MPACQAITSRVVRRQRLLRQKAVANLGGVESVGLAGDRRLDGKAKHWDPTASPRQEKRRFFGEIYVA